MTALIEIDCPVCSSSDYTVLFKDTLGEKPPVFGYKWTPDIRLTYRIVNCAQCTHSYCSPRLQDMYSHYEEVADQGYLDNKPLRIGSAEKVLTTIRQYCASGRLLDVGCSTGDFLTVARQYYDVEGLELATWAVDVAQQQDLVVHEQTLEAFSKTGEQFDVITMWGVIEHLEFPYQELLHINRLLKKNGLVCLWTGDNESIYAKIFKHKFWYILGQHIQYFNRRSLTSLMQKAGFECVYDGIYPYVISLDYLGTSLSRYPFVGWVAKKILSLPFLRNRKITLNLSSEIFAIYKKLN